MVTVTIDTKGYDKKILEELDKMVMNICKSQQKDVDYRTNHKHSIIKYNGGKIIECVLETYIQE